MYVADVTTSKTMFKRQIVIVQGPRKANRLSLDNCRYNQQYMPLVAEKKYEEKNMFSKSVNNSYSIYESRLKKKVDL